MEVHEAIAEHLPIQTQATTLFADAPRRRGLARKVEHGGGASLKLPSFSACAPHTFASRLSIEAAVGGPGAARAAKGGKTKGCRCRWVGLLLQALIMRSWRAPCLPGRGQPRPRLRRALLGDVRRDGPCFPRCT